jgi:hypothetical protein
VTDKQGRAAGTSLVTAGSVLLGTALLAAGCASSGPPALSPVSQSPDDHIKDGDLAAARGDLRAAVVTERRFYRQLMWKTRSGSSAVSSACRRPIRADRPADRG